jgi:hypothetical protein
METTEQLSALITKLEVLQRKAEPMKGKEQFQMVGQLDIVQWMTAVEAHAPTLLSLARWSLDAKEALRYYTDTEGNWPLVANGTLASFPQI